MITKLTTDEGYIYALIETELIDPEHLLIKYMWVHINHRNNGCIPSLTNMLVCDKDNKSVQFVGWERGEKRRDFQWFPVHKILRRI